MYIDNNTNIHHCHEKPWMRSDWAEKRAMDYKRSSPRSIRNAVQDPVRLLNRSAITSRTFIISGICPADSRAFPSLELASRSYLIRASCSFLGSMLSKMCKSMKCKNVRPSAGRKSFAANIEGESEISGTAWYVLVVDCAAELCCW